MTLKDKVGGAKANVDPVRSAKKLYQAILGPVLSRVPAGKRICIVPHRSLHYVPFQALHDGEKYVIETRDVFYAASGSAFVELRKRARQGGTNLLILDPILSDDPKSPFAKTETEALKKQHPEARVFVRNTATVEAFKEGSKDAGIIHVSSHGYYNPWVPIESGLVFAGPGGVGNQLLRARDIYPMKLEKTSLIVMSACVSSVGDFANGDEVTGLTRAFQVAGVPNVIGSLWPVENDATIQLMTEFYKNLSEPHDPASALRQAQIEMIGKKFPIVKWAAFELTGLGMGMVGEKK